MSSDNGLAPDESAARFRDNVRSDGLVELSRACRMSCAGANDILNDPSAPAFPSYSSLAEVERNRGDVDGVSGVG